MTAFANNVAVCFTLHFPSHICSHSHTLERHMAHARVIRRAQNIRRATVPCDPLKLKMLSAAQPDLALPSRVTMRN